MIEAVFSEGGALAAALRSMGRPARMRAPQKEYAGVVDASIAAGHPAFIDAETGVGKTLGYLVPTLLRAFSAKGNPLVVVSTASVSLQRQLLVDDIPVALAVVRDVLGLSLNAEMRVGRQQVVDPDRMEAAIADMAVAADRELADDILDWCRGRVDSGQLPLRGDLMETFADRLAGYKPWLAPAAVGLVEADEKSDVADLYRALLERCEEANVLVVNHHLLTLNMLRPFMWDVERPVHIVVDEADRLPDVVESMTRRTVPLNSLSHAILSFPKQAAAIEAVEALSSEVMKHFDDAWTGSGGAVTPLSKLDVKAKVAIGARMKAAQLALKESTDTLKKAGTPRTVSAREDLTEMRRAVLELSAIIEELDNPAGNALLYYSPVRRYPGIASLRSGSARKIAWRLWTDSKFAVRSLLFTSATLGSMTSATEDVKRALTPFITECGFRTADVPTASCALIAPDRFGEMSFVRPSLDAVRPFEQADDDLGGAVLRKEAVDEWARMILAAAAEGGRVLVLSPSHRDILALEPTLSALGERLVLQKAGVPTNAAVSRFLQRDDSVWLSASAWEGVSLPGAITHIVIPRLPIRPSSLEDNLIERYFEDRGSGSVGKSVVFGRRMVATRRRMRQGIGRGIRSAEDVVKIWIGDMRWPLTQKEMDAEFLDQPASWSSTMLNSVPKRFRKKLETSPRFASR